MNAYISTILVSAVVGGIVSSFLPNRNDGAKRQINLIIGLICAIVLLTPIVKIAKNTAILKEGIDNIVDSLNISSSIDKSNEIIVETSIENVCNGIKASLINKFDFRDEDVSVSATLDTENIEKIIITKITIILKNQATWQDGEKVKDYAQNLVGCTIEIIKA